MTYENILFNVTDGIATITMNQPAARNPLSWAMARDMSAALDRLDGARALVITGAGKGFCSGGDLAMKPAEGLDLGHELYNGLTQVVNPMLVKLHRLDIPVIAAVNGPAAGAGAPMALLADFVIAAQSSFFYFAFAQVGLVPDAGGSWILPRLVGKAQAMRMAMLAEKIPAEEAERLGMIYKCVPDDELQAETAALARRLAAGPTVSYGLIRRNTLDGLECDFDTALHNEALGQRTAGRSKDCGEAISAFMEKRQPVFRGE